MTDTTSLTRVQVRDVLRKHRGSVSLVARELNMSKTAVSLWLKGKTTSARVAAAATAKALKLMEAGQ